MEKRKTNAAIVTVSSYASALNRHWKTHTGERPNKCNQCDYATSCADVLKTHLKTHSGKSQTNATNVTMPILGQAIWGHIWKRTVGRSQIIAINATLHPCMQWRKVKQMQPVWICLWSLSQHLKMHLGKSQIDAIDVTFENTQWRKTKQMQPVWLCLFSGRQIEETF